MKPARCPVCNGSGVVRQEASPENAGDISITVTCHGCSGKGWVEVSEVDECVIVPPKESPWPSVGDTEKEELEKDLDFIGTPVHKEEDGD